MPVGFFRIGLFATSLMTMTRWRNWGGLRKAFYLRRRRSLLLNRKWPYLGRSIWRISNPFPILRLFPIFSIRPKFATKLPSFSFKGNRMRRSDHIYL